jgi:hypothetical protein
MPIFRIVYDKHKPVQIPNKFFDELLPKLKDGEIRVLLAMFQLSDRCNFNEIIDIGTEYLIRRTAMSEKKVLSSLCSLEKKNLIKKYVVQSPDKVDEFYYELAYDTEDDKLLESSHKPTQDET